MNARYLSIYITLIISFYTTLSFIYPPSMVSDAARGFIVWKSMEEGALFNHYKSPFTEDISRDTTKFLAKWSPGQYLIPALFMKTGFNLGQSLTLTTALFSLIGILGYYFLYQNLGFDRRTSLLSCTIAASMTFFAFPFGVYNGGEILLFGVAPWIILLCLRNSDLIIWQLPVVVLIFLVGAFVKLSFVICAIAVLFSLFIFKYRSSSNIVPSTIIWYVMRMLIIFFSFYVILYFTYTSKDRTAVNYSLEITSPAGGLLFALAAPLYSPISLGDFINWFFMHPANPIIHSYDEILPILFIFATVAVFIYSRILLHPDRKLYNSVLFGFLTAYATIFGFFYVTGAPVGYGDRFFRIPGMLLIPGLIEMIGNIQTRFLKLLGYLAIFIACLSGVASFFVMKGMISKNNNVGAQGFTHFIISTEALSTLRYVDTNISQGNNLIYVTSPEIALEVKRNRVFSSHADYESLEELSKKKYRGSVDNLFLILQEKFLKNGKAEAILKSFSDYTYTNWRSLNVESFVIYYQGNNPEFWKKLLSEQK